MIGYLVEVKKTERKRYVIKAQNKVKAEILANALTMCEDDINLDAVRDIFVPVDGTRVSCSANAIAESHDCEDISDAIIDFTGDSDNGEDAGIGENGDDYEPKECFSD